MTYSEYNATSVADNLGLSYHDYNFLMGLSGLLIGLVIYLVISKLASN